MPDTNQITDKPKKKGRPAKSTAIVVPKQDSSDVQGELSVAVAIDELVEKNEAILNRAQNEDSDVATEDAEQNQDSDVATEDASEQNEIKDKKETSDSFWRDIEKKRLNKKEEKKIKKAIPVIKKIKIKRTEEEKERMKKRSELKSFVRKRALESTKIFSDFEKKEIPKYIQKLLLNKSFSFEKVSVEDKMECFKYFLDNNKYSIIIGLLVKAKTEDDLLVMKNIILKEDFIKNLFASLKTE